MTQTDAEFIAELKSLAEKATPTKTTQGWAVDADAYPAFMDMVNPHNILRLLDMVARLERERNQQCALVAEYIIKRDAALSRAEKAESAHLKAVAHEKAVTQTLAAVLFAAGKPIKISNYILERLPEIIMRKDYEIEGPVYSAVYSAALKPKE